MLEERLNGLAMCSIEKDMLDDINLEPTKLVAKPRLKSTYGESTDQQTSR
jgi:hypothetical protein